MALATFADTRQEPWCACEIEGMARIIPEYSTDLAAAGLVLDALRARGYHVDIGSTIRGYVEDLRAKVPHPQWVCTIRGTRFSARADTLPHAICACARLWLQAEHNV